MLGWGGEGGTEGEGRGGCKWRRYLSPPGTSILPSRGVSPPPPPPPVLLTPRWWWWWSLALSGGKSQLPPSKQNKSNYILITVSIEFYDNKHGKRKFFPIPISKCFNSSKFSDWKHQFSLIQSTLVQSCTWPGLVVIFTISCSMISQGPPSEAPTEGRDGGYLLQYLQSLH